MTSFSFKIILSLGIALNIAPSTNGYLILGRLDLLQALLDKCSEEFSFDMRTVGRDVLRGSLNSCLLACFIKNSDIYVDGRFDVKKIEQRIIGLLPEYGLVRLRIQNAKECVDEIGTLGDGELACIRAERLFRCFQVEKPALTTSTTELITAESETDNDVEIDE